MSITIGVRTMTAAAIGAAVVLIALLGFRALSADAVGTDESTFVPTAPCRLLDARAESQVGTRGPPLGPDDSYSVQVTGTQGTCAIPAAATAVSINLTGVAPSQATFLSLYVSSGGFVAGSGNTLSAPAAWILGGSANTATEGKSPSRAATRTTPSAATRRCPATGATPPVTSTPRCWAVTRTSQAPCWRRCQRFLQQRERQ